MAYIAIVIYSLYHHVTALAEEIKIGIESTGNTATIYQVPETLPEEILTAMHAPPKPDYAIATPENLIEADGIIFGFPTRFGGLPAQLKSFIDSTGGLWQSGALYHKPASAFTSTGSGGGKETTAFSLLSTLSHHGMLYIPLGCATAFTELTNLEEVHGGSPWGAGTIAGPTGARQPSTLELKIANIQGVEFSKAVVKLSDKNRSAEPIVKTEVVDPVNLNKSTVKPESKATSALNFSGYSTPISEPSTAPTSTTNLSRKPNVIKRFFKKVFD